MRARVTISSPEMCMCAQGVLQQGYVLYKADKGTAQYQIPDGTEIDIFRKASL